MSAGLHLDRVATEVAPASQRPHERCVAGLAGEPVEAKVVVEDPGNRALEPVELREGVVPQREEHVGSRRAPDHRGKLVLEGIALGVVEEVLLGLVEQKVDIASGLAGALNDGAERAVRLDARGSRNGVGDRLRRGLRPVGEDDDDRLFLEAAQPPRDRGGKEG